jgi:hypothetical protein
MHMSAFSMCHPSWSCCQLGRFQKYNKCRSRWLGSVLRRCLHRKWTGSDPRSRTDLRLVWKSYLLSVKGRLHSHFCVRYPVRDGANAQQLPLLFSHDHVHEKARKAVGQQCHRGRRNGRKNRECRRPLTLCQGHFLKHCNWGFIKG